MRVTFSFHTRNNNNNETDKTNRNVQPSSFNRIIFTEVKRAKIPRDKKMCDYLIEEIGCQHQNVHPWNHSDTTGILYTFFLKKLVYSKREKCWSKN